MAYGKFEFYGTGLSCLWLFIWTTVLSVITFGLCFPWTASAFMRWIAENTTIDGKQLCFKGTGLGFFANWLLMLIFTLITFGIYLPWGICRINRWAINNTYYASEGDIEHFGSSAEIAIPTDVEKTENIQIQSKKSQDVVLIENAKKYLQKENWAKAIELLTTSINSNYDTVTAYYLRAVAYSKIHEKHKAQNDLEQSAKLGNKQAIARLKKIHKKNNISKEQEIYNHGDCPDCGAEIDGIDERCLECGIFLTKYQ